MQVRNGAAIGGVMGGISGAIQRASLKNNDYLMNGDNAFADADYFRSQNELNAYIDKSIGNLDEIQSNFKTDITLASVNNLPDGYSLDNNSMYNASGLLVGGSTIPEEGWFTSLKSKIFVSPGLKGAVSNSVSVTKMAINHELIHAYHYAKGLQNHALYSERAASSYSLAYGKAYGFSNKLLNIYRNAVNNYPKSYSWRILIGLINLGIQ